MRFGDDGGGCWEGETDATQVRHSDRGMESEVTSPQPGQLMSSPMMKNLERNRQFSEKVGYCRAVEMKSLRMVELVCLREHSR